MLPKYPQINKALLILNFNFYFTICFNPKQGPRQVIYIKAMLKEVKKSYGDYGHTKVSCNI